MQNDSSKTKNDKLESVVSGKEQDAFSNDLRKGISGLSFHSYDKKTQEIADEKRKRELAEQESIRKATEEEQKRKEEKRRQVQAVWRLAYQILRADHVVYCHVQLCLVYFQHFGGFLRQLLAGHEAMAVV